MPTPALSSARSIRPRRLARWVLGLGALALAGNACQQAQRSQSATESASSMPAFSAADTAASQQAFLAAYSVFMHPRCMNCHPSGDQPLQGDDSHVHTQFVKRGADGKGLYALKCANCHQQENVPGKNMPPGHPQWHLPPADRKMVFQGKSPAQLAADFKDPSKTGKTMEQMIDHVTNDSLVGVGWNPGEGRTLPPLTRAEFAAKFKEWVDKGAAIPQ